MLNQIMSSLLLITMYRIIRQCLDKLMMQDTNFTFEVLLHHDASTDGTVALIQEYEA